jgi:hypothetical protein
MATEPYRLSQVSSLTGLSRQLLHQFLKFYRISWGGAEKTRGKPKRLNDLGVRQLRLIAALKKDVRWEDYEVESILTKMDPEEFWQLFSTKPFPELLDELKSRRVQIDETPFLDRALKNDLSPMPSPKP